MDGDPRMSKPTAARPRHRRTRSGWWGRPILVAVGLAAVATGAVVAVAPTAPAPTPGSRWSAWTAAATTSAHPDLGARRSPVRPGGSRPLRRRDRPTGRPAPTPGRSATAYSTIRCRTSSPSGGSASGAGCGDSFSTTPSGYRQETGAGATPMDVAVLGRRPDGELHTATLGVIAVDRSAQAPGTGTGPGNPRQQTNTLSTYLNASAVYGTTDARLDWLRAGGRRRPDRQPGPPAAPGRLPADPGRAGQPGRRAADGRGRPAGRRTAGRRRGRGCPGQREHRPDRDPDPVRPGAQPDRRHAAGTTVRRGQIPDRPPGRHRRAAVRHVPGVPARDGGGPAAPTAGTTRASTRP